MARHPSHPARPPKDCALRPAGGRFALRYPSFHGTRPPSDLHRPRDLLPRGRFLH
ncbi:hypothetical protein D516_4027 [Rhodobacter sp. AKP1]|nr:hypothetical protein D516_4027 [Rhodobacter sp. AKP1]